MRLRHHFLILLSALFVSCAPDVALMDHGNRDLKVIHLPSQINSIEDDYAPVLIGETMYFTSRRMASEGGDDYDKLYLSRLLNGTWEKPVRALPHEPIDLNEGSFTFDLSRSVVLFTQCYRKDGVGDCDIYQAELRDGKLLKLQNPGEPLNNVEWDSHPSLTQDGRVLYFSSERHGGFGGSDIWTSKRLANGQWSIPENIGQTINTSGDEKTPYISPDGNTLYFSSDSHGGFGDFDLFQSKKVNGNWTQPLNLGKPYNSRHDELFYSATPTGDTAVFSSNRTGSIGGLDIYMVVRSPKPEPPPPPIVREPLSIRYTTRNAFTLSPVETFITFTDDGGTEERIRTDEDGKTEIRRIDAGRRYFLTAERIGFLSAVDTIFYSPDAYGHHERELLLVPVREKERIIYSFVVEFDFDYFNIRPEEKRHLDSAVIVLAKFPHSVVVVTGHTDSLGTESYNLRLGWNRAKEVSTYVGKYMKEKGAKLEKPLEVRTYGEELPIASNATEEGRQRNRRVEIAIVRYD